MRTARDLVNEPANVLTPPGDGGARAQAMSDDAGLRCTVLNEDAMRELGMGILLAVSVGSVNPAQMIMLEHAPAGHEEEAPLVLVGKGITFDTGWHHPEAQRRHVDDEGRHGGRGRGDRGRWKQLRGSA